MGGRERKSGKFGDIFQFPHAPHASTGVRALGDSPEVAGMHEAGKQGAGIAARHRHHVFPQEHRAWFEERGFVGDVDIDHFTVELDPAIHQAVHGGGDWRLGRTWVGEWNRQVMATLKRLEVGLAWKQLCVLSIPTGWLPDGPDDPLIMQAFRGTRFAKESATE